LSLFEGAKATQPEKVGTVFAKKWVSLKNMRVFQVYFEVDEGEMK